METRSAGSNACPLGFLGVYPSHVCLFALSLTRRFLPVFKEGNKRVMRLTGVSPFFSFLFFVTGLSAYCRGLAKDPDGQISCHQPPWRHEDLAKVRQPVWKERAPGQYLWRAPPHFLSPFFSPDPDRCRVNYNPITFRKDKSEMIEISLVRRRKMEVELWQR